MKARTRQWMLVIFLLLVVVVGLAGIKASQILAMINAGKSFVPPPESVTSAKAQTATWQPTSVAIGTLVAERTVTLGVELVGTVREVAFDSGTSVKKGALLVRLDTSTEEAQLDAAAAEQTLARLNLERVSKLRQDGVNAPADLEQADARAKQADANLASLKATIAKKTIRAPFDGRVTIRQVEPGQVLSPGTPIATLQSVSPIHAEFWLPQQALASVGLGQRVHMHADVFADASWDGEITTINTEVDVATRNVRVRATFPNHDGRLRPGMFVKVEVLSGDPQSVLIIPATAVIFAPYGDSVFVLAQKKEGAGPPGLVARQKFVRLGERRGDMVAVLSGLEAGETVVSSGAFKLRNGATVVLHNELAPQLELAPKPADD